MRSVEVYIKDNQEVWTRLDLFDYETIDITNSIQDVKEIGKVFTDFSKEFDVPASNTNNKVFKHYYNPDIDGFDARFKLDALIKIDGVDYRKGKISLLGSSLHNDIAKSYQVVFYGETVALSDLLGDDTLRSLSGQEVDNYTFDFSSNTIMDGLESGFVYNSSTEELDTVTDDSYDLCFPFISSKSFYFYDSTNGANPKDKVDSRNVLMPSNDSSDIGSNLPRGIHYDDLKPALRVDKIIRSIESKYNLSFSDHFFSQNNKPYYDLFLWMQRESGTLSEQIGNQEVRLTLDNLTFSTDDEQRSSHSQTPTFKYLDTFVGQNVGSFGINTGLLKRKNLNMRVEFRDGNGDLDVVNNATVDVYANIYQWDGSSSQLVKKLDNQLIKSFDILAQSQKDIEVIFEKTTWNGIFDKYWVYEPEIVIKFPNVIQEVTFGDIFIYEETSNPNFTSSLPNFSQTSEGEYEISSVSSFDNVKSTLSDYFPKIKIIDFLTGLFKMFNLTAYYDGIEIVVRTLDDYYQDGVGYNLTKYIDTSNTDVKRNNLYSQIDMKFSKSSTFAAQNANEIQQDYIKRDFGNEKLDTTIERLNDDSQIDLAFDGGKYEIKAPFEKVMYERMSNQATQGVGLTVFQWGWFCNKDENPVLGKPLLFYPIKTAGNYLFDKNVKGDNWDNWQSDAYGSNNYTEILNSYIRPSNSTDDYAYSLNFGSERDEYTLTDNNNSLFLNYWSNYISNIYNKKSRIFTISAFLPTHILTNLKLNDVVVIGNRKYRINKLEVNLNNGKAKLELFNDLLVFNQSTSTPITDTEAPVITLLGANPHTVQQDDVYVQQGATATDNVDGGLSNQITYTTDLDMSTTGTYTQVYSVTDSSGNTGTATRTIIVASDITAPQFQVPSVAINLVSGMSGSTVGNFQINAVDNVGVTNFLFKMNGTTKYNGAPTAGTAGSNQQAEVFVTGIPTGVDVTFELTASDAAGNYNTITRIINNS